MLSQSWTRMHDIYSTSMLNVGQHCDAEGFQCTEVPFQPDSSASRHVNSSAVSSRVAPSSFHGAPRFVVEHVLFAEFPRSSCSDSGFSIVQRSVGGALDARFRKKSSQVSDDSSRSPPRLPDGSTRRQSVTWFSPGSIQTCGDHWNIPEHQGR